MMAFGLAGHPGEQMRLWRGVPLGLTDASAHAPSATEQTAALFTTVWREVTGRQGPRSSELQTVLAISKLETGLGRGWSGPMSGSNNFGAVQCTSHDLSVGPPDYYVCVEHEDHHADGTPYKTGFRSYVDARGRSAQQNGAWDFLRQLYAPIRARTGTALARGASLYDVADAMHREKYFEGDARGGRDPVLGYAQGLDTRVRQIARELGQAPAVTLRTGAGGSSSAVLVLLALVAGAYLVSEDP